MTPEFVESVLTPYYNFDQICNDNLNNEYI